MSKRLLSAIVVVTSCLSFAQFPAQADWPGGSSSSGGSTPTYGIDYLSEQTSASVFVQSTVSSGEAAPEPTPTTATDGPVANVSDTSEGTPSLDLHQIHPNVYGGGLTVSYHGPANTVINLAVSGAPIILSCSASDATVQITGNNTHHIIATLIHAASTGILTCYVSAPEPMLEANMVATTVAVAMSAPGVADKPTSGQVGVTVVMAEATVDSVKDLPGDFIFSFTATQQPFERPEDEPLQAFNNAGNTPGCGPNGSTTAYGCLIPQPPSIEPKLNAVLLGTTFQQNNQTGLRCTFGKVRLKVANTNQTQVVDSLYYTGDLTASAILKYVTFKPSSSPNYPKQWAALKKLSDAVLTHERKHAENAKQYFEQDLKTIFVSKVAPATLAAIKQQYGLENGIFNVLPIPANVQNMDASTACSTLAYDQMRGALLKLVGTADDAYIPHTNPKKLRPQGEPSTALGKMVLKDAYWDLAKGWMCFFASENDPDPDFDFIFTQGGCKQGNIRFSWEAKIINGTFSPAADNHFVYTAH